MKEIHSLYLMYFIVLLIKLILICSIIYAGYYVYLCRGTIYFYVFAVGMFAECLILAQYCDVSKVIYNKIMKE